jgi:hypothetical protein
MSTVYLDFPLPKALVLLCLFLPGIQALGWCIARRVFADRLTASVASVGLSISLWLFCTHVIGLVTHSLTAALVASTLGLGGAGGVLWIRERRRHERWAPLPRGSWEMFLFAAAMTLPVGILAWRWSFHDEIGPGTHQAIISNLQNDFYPPRSLAFPEFDLAYHFGFDLLCAMLTALFRLSITQSIDVLASLLWFYAVLGAWLVGERTVGRSTGPLVAAVLLLGGGSSWTCGESMRQALPFAGHFLTFCSEGGTLLNPNIAAYFFQHPWTLGLPIALTILLVDGEAEPRHPWLKVGALVVLFGALYVTQIVLFFTLLAAVCASQLLSERSLGFKRRLALVSPLVLSGLLYIALLGGFLSGKSANTSGLEPHLGVADTKVSSLWWMLKSFGVPLLGFFGFFWLPRKRVLYASLALGGIVVINVVRYKLSWDIVKFATVASIGLAVPLAALIHRLRGSRRRLTRSWIPTYLLIATLGPSVVFLAVLTFELPGIPYMYTVEQPAMSPDARAAAVFLRRTMPHDAVMFRRANDFLPYAIYAGLPQVWINSGLGLDNKLAPERVKLCETLPEAPEPYLRQRVRFFVLDSGDTRLNLVVDGWLKTGAAVSRARFGALRVVELLPRTKAG